MIYSRDYFTLHEADPIFSLLTDNGMQFLHYNITVGVYGNQEYPTIDGISIDIWLMNLLHGKIQTEKTDFTFTVNGKEHESWLVQENNMDYLSRILYTILEAKLELHKVAFVKISQI